MEQQRNSRLGLASLVTSTVSAVLLFLLLVVAGAMETSTPGGMDEESAEAVVIGALLLICSGAQLVALVLGLAGLFQSECKKTFAILGTVFSSLAIVGMIAILAIGLALG